MPLLKLILKFCQQDISVTIRARSLKLDDRTENVFTVPDYILEKKKSFFFWSYAPCCKLIKLCQQDVQITI